MFGRKKAAEQAPIISTEELAQMFPPIAESLEEAASRAGASPCDMQSAFWFQALRP